MTEKILGKKDDCQNICYNSCGMVGQGNVAAYIFYGFWSMKNILIKMIVLHYGKYCSVLRYSKIRKIVFGRLTRSYNSGYFIANSENLFFSGCIFFIVTVFINHKFRIKYFQSY